MQIPKATVLLALAGAAVAAPVLAPRVDGGPLAVQVSEQDIGAIDTAVRELTASINAYQGGVAEATPILTGVANIHLVNRKAYLDAMAPVTLNSTESGEVVTFTDNTVGESIPESIAALDAKYSQLTAAGLDSSVVDGLELLKSDHETYSEELLQKVSPDWLSRAQAVVLKIDNAIQQGIDEFAGFTDS